MNRATPPTVTRRPWWLLGLAVVLAISLSAAAAGLAILDSPGAAGGTQSGTAFLGHWQQTEVLSSATPNPVPAVLSQAAATPTRLPALAGMFALNTGVVGHQAVQWTFSESVGMSVNQEVEITVDVQYAVGGVAHTAATTVFVESQAVAIPLVLTFNLYWDAGAATGITFSSESEISQGCVSVGSCP